MLQTNSHQDPIVEILRLAYRRGLAIQRERAETSKAFNPLQSEHEDSALAVEAKEDQGEIKE